MKITGVVSLNEYIEQGGPELQGEKNTSSQFEIPEEVAEVSFVNVNDGTVEGLTYKNKKIFTVQFHPEACAGPKDSEVLFERFMKMMDCKED